MPRKTFSNEAERLLSPQLDKLESASLRLSKYTFIGDNSKKDQINAVCNLSKRNIIPPKVISGDMDFSMKLGGRLMVNMAGSILENSGLCLHPFFNYPMIPGSALKGLASHAAWMEWKEKMEEEKIEEAKKIAGRIVSIFGSPVGSKELDKFIKEKIPSDSKEKAGSIAFLPAASANNNWHLVPDVLTPHGGSDYKNPVPSFFIAVEKDAEFRFSLKKTPRANDNDISLAEKWLKKGLTEYGVGAKTVAGYGFFLPDSAKEENGITLKLASPGFFGGADHGKKEDTLLRAPSLRGMLRWWWKTLYRDIISGKEMEKLEDVLWGATSTGKSLISIKIASHQNLNQELFNYKDRFNPTPEFKRKHNLMDGRPQPQGLFYLSYGMDERDKKRYFLDSGACWKLDISARKGKTKLSEENIRNQALAALSLLCRFGGIGSKSRKGFGSIAWENAWTLEKCRQEAKSFCLKIGIKLRETSAPYSWKTAILSEIQTPWKDTWTVIDRLGFAVQLFAQNYKHDERKAVLGLPRKIHGPRREPMDHQRGQHRPPEDLYPSLEEANNGKNTRFASPIWYHIEPNGNGSLIRITAFPSDMICDIDTSRNMYDELIEHVEKKLKEYAEAPQQAMPQTANTSQKPRQPTFQPSTSCGYKAGSRVKAVLLEEKTKKGGWKAKVEGTDIVGPIQNSDKIPSTCAPGQQVELVLKIAKGADSAFVWPV